MSNIRKNSISKILKSLDQSSLNYNKARDKASKWADDLGFQMELVDGQRKLWQDFSKVDVPPVVTTSGVVMGQEMLKQSQRVVDSLWSNSQIDESISTASTASEYMAGTAMSGATLSYPLGAYPNSYHQLNNIIIQRNETDLITSKLEAIEQSLADEYRNAWMNLHVSSKDETRSPMFLIREVVTRLYHHYGPDEQVKQYFLSDKKVSKVINDKGIQRKHRIDYITSIITDPWKQSAFQSQAKSFLKIYPQLSKAHKHGRLNTEQTKGFLYQANALIKIILDSLQT